MRYLLFLFLLPLTLFGQSQKISDMTSATTLSGTELVPIVQTTNKKATVSLLRGFGSYGTAGQYMTVNGTANGFTFVTPPFISAYPGAGIAVSTGSAWGTSITDNSSNWNTAFGWGNHAGLYWPFTGTASLTGDVNINGNGTADFQMGVTGTKPVDIKLWASNQIELFGNVLADITSFGDITIKSDDNVTTTSTLLLSNGTPAGSLRTTDGVTEGGIITTPSSVEIFAPDVKLQTSSTVGHVWTANDTDGSGEWAAPSGGGDMLLGTIQTVTARKDFNTGTFSLFNPANTFKYNFLGSAIVADRTVTLPLLTGNDTFVMNDFGATLTNKTLVDAKIRQNVRTETGITYTIQASDEGLDIFFTNASDITVTLPNGLSDDFMCFVYKKGTGNVILSATTTLEAVDNTITVLNTGASVKHTGSNIWQADGSLGTPVTQYTNELAQDAVGAMVDASLNYVDGTPLLQRAALTGDVTAAAGSNATTIAAGAVDIAMLSATGTPSGSTYLRGDNTWAAASGGGNVTKVGTPVDNQIGVWTGDGTIEGNAKFTYDASTNYMTMGNATSDAQIVFNYGLANGANFTGQYSGVNQLALGFSNGAIFSGVADATSGRTNYAYDFIDSKFLGGFHGTGFTIGESSTRYGLNVVRPNASVTGLNILATGQAQLGEYTATSSFTGTPVGYLQFDASGNILTSALPSGGGYTNLTSFVDQTPWRLFYSNTSGDVTELAFGASNTYLKSNGVSAAPTFEVISVPDGSYGAISVASSGTVWDINAATVGITQLSASGTPSASTYLRGDNTWATVSGGSGLTYAQVKAMKFK